MSEYVNVASSGPSAAFFDLDRTLISGSSAFTLALQARKAGLIPNVEFARDAAGAISFKLFGREDQGHVSVKQPALGGLLGNVTVGENGVRLQVQALSLLLQLLENVR